MQGIAAGKKEEIEEVGRCTPLGKATVKGRERGVMRHLGFRNVQREKGDMFTQDQNSNLDLIT